MAKNKFLPQSTADNAYDLLSEIVNLILDEPLRYNQGTWLLDGNFLAHNSQYQRPMCDTVGCVAGWAVSLKNKVPVGYEARGWRQSAELEKNAQVLLGLTDNQEMELFDGDAVRDIARHIWRRGGSIGEMPNPKKQTQEYALLGAMHIRLFQFKHEAQLKGKAV